jgi:hypothetical protein
MKSISDTTCLYWIARVIIIITTFIIRATAGAPRGAQTVNVAQVVVVTNVTIRILGVMKGVTNVTSTVAPLTAADVVTAANVTAANVTAAIVTAAIVTAAVTAAGAIVNSPGFLLSISGIRSKCSPECSYIFLLLLQWST